MYLHHFYFFSTIYINIYVKMCAHTHTHTLLSPSFCVTWLINICLVLNIKTGYQRTCHWIKLLSPSLRAREYPKAPHAEVDLVRLIHLHWHVEWCCHYAGLVKATILLRFHGSASLSCLCSRQSGFLTLIIFLTPLQRGFIADVPNGVEHFTVTYFLHFDQLWFL